MANNINSTGISVKKKRILLFVIIVSVAVAIGLFLYGKYKSIEELRVIKVSGNIEGNEVRISFRVGGYIQELLADEGARIKTGDVLARLDKSPLEKQVNETAAALKLAKSQYEFDELEYVRAENLFREGAVSAQNRDTAKTKAETERSNIDKLEASLEINQLQLEWGDLVSPLNGYITIKSALQGENVQSGSPVFSAVDLNDVWVSAYVDEKDLGKIKLGQKAEIRIDAYPKKKYNGWISFISQDTEYTPKYIQTTKERVKYVYRIKVKADNTSLDLKPGMPADAYIFINGQ